MCCATGTCSQPGLCETCRWIGYVIAHCARQVNGIRCRLISGHLGSCLQMEREPSLKAAERKSKRAARAVDPMTRTQKNRSPTPRTDASVLRDGGQLVESLESS